MSRQTRKSSATGVYHVMLRGINKQDIFEEAGDYWKFLRLIRLHTHPQDKSGQALPPHCVVYAYCLMSNHVHLLIKEQGETLTATMRSIAIAYAQYFNVKYDRSGQLFQDRFKSEPVDDAAYFLTLLRYIHQNPIAAGLVTDVRDYTWSSWCEYEGQRPCHVPVCSTAPVLSRFPIDYLSEQVNTPLSKALRILDFDQDTSVRIGDELIREFLAADCGISNASEIQHLAKDDRNEVVRRIKAFGASIRQISRITGISEGIIRNIH